MKRRLLWLSIAAVAATLTAALIWWSAPTVAPVTAPAGLPAGEPGDAGHAAASPAREESPADAARVGDEAARPTPSPTRPGRRGKPADLVVQPVADLHLNPALAGATWDFEAYRSATAQPDSVGPETAYAAFDYLRSCIAVPRGEAEFEMRVEQYNILYEQNRRRLNERRFQRIVDELQAGYLRCDGLSDTDVVASAVEWLQLAADLGHLRAQIHFYRELPELLRRAPGRLFREPHYLDLHREKSIDYFRRALASGHPQAFRAYAEAILDDVLFEPDLTAAFAHLYAADLAAAGALPDIGEQLVRLEQRMTAGDVAYARDWGRQLCRQWCVLRR